MEELRVFVRREEAARLAVVPIALVRDRQIPYRAAIASHVSEESPQIFGVFEFELWFQRRLALSALFVVRLHPRWRRQDCGEEFDPRTPFARGFGDGDGVLAVFEIRGIERGRPRVGVVVRRFVRRANHEVQIPRVHLREHVVIQLALTGVFLPCREAGDVSFVKHRPAAEALEFLSHLTGMHGDSHGWRGLRRDGGKDCDERQSAPIHDLQ
jgi:hypothetical protein